MQQVNSESTKNKDYVTTAKKKSVKKLNLWLSKIGKALNTSQLSNYK